jgi:preprotein translocase subunit SecY
MSVLSAFRSALTTPDLRKKILFTLAMVAVYRAGAAIPAPGVSYPNVQECIRQVEGGENSSVYSLINLFSGGALLQLSIFALGIMPYITASIIVQLLTVVIPRFEQLKKEGQSGQNKLTQYTRYLTIALAILQSTGIVALADRGQLFGNCTQPVIPESSIFMLSIIVITMTAGTAVIMWLGEQVTERGIGNGMSLLIFSSIAARIPAEGRNILQNSGGLVFAGVCVFGLAIIASVVFVEQGQRRIPVQFAKRVVGRRQYGGQSSYIPLKVNQSGVIPIIFASSVLYLPVLLTNVLPTEGFGNSVRGWIDDNLLQPDNFVYITIYGLLIIFFAYFYTAITFDPAKQADTIRKQGGFIPGIRPGPQTERHLAKILSRITLPGALFIAAVALIPALLLVLWGVQRFQGFGGTSLLIAVGVALETMKQIDSQLMMRNYESFLK